FGAAAILAAAAYWIGNSRSVRMITLTPGAIKADGKTYDLDHVSAISQSGPRVGNVITTEFNAGVAAIGQQTNQMLYIVYGSREIKLIQGQTPASMSMIYSVIVGYLRSVGRQVGEANDNDVANYRATVQRGGAPRTLPKWLPVTAAVVVALGAVGFWAANERVKENRARDAIDIEARRVASEQRNAANMLKNFEDDARPDLSGKYFIVGENTRLSKDAASRPGNFYIKAGSCVRALKVSQAMIQFDVTVLEQFGVARETTKLAPDGKCNPTRDPIGKWG
ncbi:MAG: hypothetical protein ACK4S3_09865, partial [Parvibaculum sp.]